MAVRPTLLMRGGSAWRFDGPGVRAVGWQWWSVEAPTSLRSPTADPLGRTARLAGRVLPAVLAGVRAWQLREPVARAALRPAHGRALARRRDGRVLPRLRASLPAPRAALPAARAAGERPPP